MPTATEIRADGLPAPTMPPCSVDDDQQLVVFDVMRGVEGPSLYLENFRVSGRKPWGGGTVAYRFAADPREIIELCEKALGQNKEATDGR